MMVGALEREQRAWERTAWHVAHELNVSGKVVKRTVTVDQLLGRKAELTPVDTEADFETLWARVQAKRDQETN